MSGNHSPQDSRPSVETPPRDLSGRTLAGYQVLRKLGEGGMGEVYLAEQTSLKRKVALKVMRPELTANPNALIRFKAEAEAVARVTHANIVQVHEFGEAEGVLFMAMEYVEGPNLKNYFARKGPPDLPVALSIMRQVAAALQRAGELGIVHRDIKPENILLTRKGEVKVADFGLSRCLEADTPALDITRAGTTVGTPIYMSPEQFEGKTLDPRTDIYSFGVTCYYMLTGDLPFRGNTAFELALQHVQKPPPDIKEARPDLPEAFCAIVHKMLAKKRSKRYQTGRELLVDLARLREEMSGTMVVRSPAETTELKDIPAVLAVEEDAEEGKKEREEEEEEEEEEQPGPLAGFVDLWEQHRVLLVTAAVSALMLVMVGIAALVWRSRDLAQAQPPSQEKPIDGEPRPPAGPEPAKGIAVTKSREQILREAVEQHLNAPAGKAPDAAGVGVCTDLGILYLEGKRLDEAETLFTRMDAVSQPRSYHQLGRLGRGIVLALRNQAQESNRCFKDVLAPSPGLTGSPKLTSPPSKKRFGLGKRPPGEGMVSKQMRQLNETLQPIRGQLDQEEWRQQLGLARWANRKNGVSDEQVPTYLLTRFPVRR